MTGYRKVIAVMDAAGIEDGPYRSPNGLRHAFGVNSILNKVPLNTLKKWMGHSKIDTTAIYATTPTTAASPLKSKFLSV